KGPLEPDLKAQAQALGISHKVRFAGQVPNARRYFRAFDHFVLSSDHEPFGMVLLEAMAAELNISCSDSGGGAEVVRGIGQLFPLGDAASLANLMVAVATQDQLPGTMLKYLQQHFSDEAARQRFFALPFIQGLQQRCT
ncbi:MAG: glycosyltransferase, partial [Methylobacillus glycogenes]|nr:glycosyltransferase [Methylobacillus glycogenes]